MGSPAEVHRPSCSTACRILVPRPGIELVSPALQDGLSTTGPPGKPFLKFFNVHIFLISSLWFSNQCAHMNTCASTQLYLCACIFYPSKNRNSTEQRSTNYGPLTRSILMLPVFPNIVFWAHSHVHSFPCCLRLHSRVTARAKQLWQTAWSFLYLYIILNTTIWPSTKNICLYVLSRDMFVIWVTLKTILRNNLLAFKVFFPKINSIVIYEGEKFQP